MRLFANCGDAISEIGRDLSEMGIERKTSTMQDKSIADNPEFVTKELFNYSFGIVNTIRDLDKLFQLSGHENLIDWAQMEFLERVSPHFENPGDAWEERPEVWKEFMTRHKGRFAYTYNERIRTQLDYIIQALRDDPMTRQAYLSIWDRTIDPARILRDRVPCSLGYHFISEGGGKLDVIYTMRSCDFVTHMPNDIYLAIRLLQWVADRTEMSVNTFYMNVSSLHYYKKDEGKLIEFMRGKR